MRHHWEAKTCGPRLRAYVCCWLLAGLSIPRATSSSLSSSRKGRYFLACSRDHAHRTGSNGTQMRSTAASRRAYADSEQGISSGAGGRAPTDVKYVYMSPKYVVCSRNNGRPQAQTFCLEHVGRARRLRGG